MTKQEPSTNLRLAELKKRATRVSAEVEYQIKIMRITRKLLLKQDKVCIKKGR